MNPGPKVFQVFESQSVPHRKNGLLDSSSGITGRLNWSLEGVGRSD